ncbi:hypothetical protein ATCC90586_002992 [Pythium insidiosum]|nr:hypothetical protein ATCC90586_002992 [Pythium insidiosum]
MATCLPFITLAQISERMAILRYSYVLIFFLVIYIFEMIGAVFMGAITMALFNDIVDFSNGELSSSWGSSYERSVPDTAATAVSISAFGYIAGVIGSLSTLVAFILIWQLRTKVRERFMIPGSCCGDYCCVWWCSCCVIAQLATHVKSYKPGSCDFGPPDTLPPYRE